MAKTAPVVVTLTLEVPENKHDEARYSSPAGSLYLRRSLFAGEPPATLTLSGLGLLDARAADARAEARRAERAARLAANTAPAKPAPAPAAPAKAAKTEPVPAAPKAKRAKAAA